MHRLCQTLLSVEHVHFIAGRMGAEGFRSRAPGSAEGHDVPVLVRAGPATPLGVASLQAWRARSAEHAGFPRCDLPDDAAEWFTSLGNGHFNQACPPVRPASPLAPLAAPALPARADGPPAQALNLYRLNWTSIFTGERYKVCPIHDQPLRQAIDCGIASIVLRADTPRTARKELSLALNRAHDLKWVVDEASGEARGRWRGGRRRGGAPA